MPTASKIGLQSVLMAMACILVLSSGGAFEASAGKCSDLDLRKCRKNIEKQAKKTGKEAERIAGQGGELIDNTFKEIVETGGEIDKYYRDHESEIVTVAAVVAAVYTACAAGCDVIVMGVKIGSIEAAGAAGIATSAAVNNAKEEPAPQTQPEEVVEVATSDSLDEYKQRGSLVDPSTIQWRTYSLLTMESNGDSPGDNAVAESIKNEILDYASLSDIPCKWFDRHWFQIWFGILSSNMIAN